MGEAKLRADAEAAHPLDPPRAVTLQESFEHERRRASLLEQIVVDQLATMGLLLEEHTRQIKVLEAALKPKSSIIKLHG